MFWYLYHHDFRTYEDVGFDCALNVPPSSSRSELEVRLDCDTWMSVMQQVVTCLHENDLPNMIEKYLGICIHWTGKKGQSKVAKHNKYLHVIVLFGPTLAAMYTCVLLFKKKLSTIASEHCNALFFLTVGKWQ